MRATYVDADADTGLSIVRVSLTIPAPAVLQSPRRRYGCTSGDRGSGALGKRRVAEREIHGGDHRRRDEMKGPKVGSRNSHPNGVVTGSEKIYSVHVGPPSFISCTSLDEYIGAEEM